MDFSYTQAKAIINELGRFTISKWSHYEMTVIDTDSGEFAIGTDNEAQESWETNINDYIDECVLNELPEHLQSYFDRESFMRDCSYDGRGHSLSSYDGHELEIADLFAYRLN